MIYLCCLSNGVRNFLENFKQFKLRNLLVIVFIHSANKFLNI